MEVTSEFAGSKVKDQDKDQKNGGRTGWDFDRVWNGSFTIDLPDMDSQGFSLTEDRNWTGHTKDVPIWPTRAGADWPACIDQGSSFPKDPSWGQDNPSDNTWKSFWYHNMDHSFPARQAQ